MEIGLYVKSLREQRGLSQTELAKLSGLASSFISLVESGKRKDLTGDSIRKLCHALKISANDFYRETSDKPVVKDAPVRSMQDVFIEFRNVMPIAVPVVADMHAPGRVMDYIYIPKPSNGHKNFFAIRVKGDCLSPTVEDGDYIIIDKDDAAEPGKSVLCYHNGEEHPRIIRMKKPGDLADCDVYGVILWIMKRP